MSNVITDRVVFFLKDHPPFSFLSDEEREEVAQKITVKYQQKDSILFEENQANNGFAYVLRQGSVQLISEGKLLDQCEPGDVFGVRSILSGNPYVMSAKSDEESLVYAIPVGVFQNFLTKNTEFALFFTKGYASGMVVARKEKAGENLTLQTSSTFDQPLEYSKNVLTCTSNISIQEASKLMASRGVGSIVIVNEKTHPIGIVTDKDLRNKVVAGGLDIQAKISTIMSSPVKTVHPISTVTECQAQMIKSGVHHLIMSEDGSPNSPVCGVISDHDLIVSQRNHPIALVKGLKNADDLESWVEIRNSSDELLKEYLKQGAKMEVLTSLITTLNDLIITKSIKKAVESTPKAQDIPFCWLSLGSEGREEQLLRTDQDNAIVFGDQTDSSAQSILLEMAEKVNNDLMACGFIECPANIMARNPEYCQSLDSWKKRFDLWISVPEPKALMNSTIFFDFREVWGEISLANQLRKHLLDQIKSNELFTSFLAQNATQNPPPLSFFKQFLVEKNGEHKDEFDIKKRAMMPLSDAARVLILNHGIGNIQSTVERFKKLAELEANNRPLFEEAASAYEECMRQRVINGLRDGDSGRYIELKDMKKLEKGMLRNAFSTISDLQELMGTRFRLGYFG